MNDLSISFEVSKKSTRNKGKNLIDFPDNYYVIDIETTGLDPNFDEIIELAAIRVLNNEIVDVFQSLVKPVNEISFYVERLTGITNEMVSDAPKIEDTLPEFLAFINDGIVVGHNINFDINFIYDNSILIGKEFKNNFIDTMRLARKLYPELAHHRLKDMITYFEFPKGKMHRALTDCEYTNQVFQHIRQYVLDVYDTVDDFAKLFSKKKYVYKQKLKATDLATSQTVFDESHPLFNKLCVFTGTLNLPRKQAMQYVLDLGGRVGDRLTKETNFLIVGDYKNVSSVKNGKTSKIQKAESYQLNGCDIQIISENVFYDLISDFGDDSNEQ